jgi:hypothetical protein
MRIVYYSSSLSGVGRLANGIAIGNALERKGVRGAYTILHTSPFGRLADEFRNIKVPLETHEELSEENYASSVLYKTLAKLKPDVLLVNHQWFMLSRFLDRLPCKKIYLADYVYDSHFRVPLPGGDLVFDPGQYDRVLSIEPFESYVEMEHINPLVMRNRDEILPRDTALKRLKLSGERKVALYSFSGYEGDYESYLAKYAYLEDEYDVVRTSTFREMLFPVVDYFNAFDLIVCGAGYHHIWEAVFFDKKAVFEPSRMRFGDQTVRIAASRGFRFDLNGADQLVDIIGKL